MSSMNRGGTRSEADFYSTPAWCVEWLLREWRPQPIRRSDERRDRPLRLLEPCAGTGGIISACNAAPGVEAEWTANELDAARCAELRRSQLVANERITCGDFLSWPSRGHGVGPFDAIIANPPYSLALEFLRKGLEIAPVVCFLLRLNFLGSQTRSSLLQENPPDVYVLSRRPSFAGRGTDSTEYAWFVWDLDRNRYRARYGMWSILDGGQLHREKPITQIGAVKVFRGEPPDGNPYRANGLAGREAQKAMIVFRDGIVPNPYTFWWAPWEGGARRIYDPLEIDWFASGVPVKLEEW